MLELTYSIYESDGQSVEQPIRDNEEIYERDRLAVQNMDEGRWLIGDDSLLLVPAYVDGMRAEASIAEHAKHIGVGRDSIKAYRKNCTFYPNPERDEFRTRYPHPLTAYSLFRSARKMKDRELAYEMLELAAQGEWSVNQLEYKIAERLGTLEPSDAEPDATPGPLLATLARKLVQWDARKGELTIAVDDVAAVESFVTFWRANKNPMMITVTEPE